ncbi:hypothetical protein K438DRAFT_2112992 [Mycena galopus ATCC 62051]|nr:hypothetical protein K438DRAFT_2112992 [Mycena galopus ATCC 62051]
MPLPLQISLCNACDRTFTQSPLLPTSARSAQLLQILRTNCAASACHLSELGDVIAGAPAEITRYDAELEKLDAVFEQLMASREALRRLYDQCYSIIYAPIRRLPREILIEIFKFCQESPREECHWAGDPISAESWERETTQELRRVAGGDLVAFSQVSNHWRQVVVGTPTLWSYVALDLRCWAFPIETTRASHAHHQSVRLLTLALARAKEVPLTVAVNGLGECHPLALQTLAAAACRWRSATFTLDCDMLRNLAAVAGNLPLLETLCVNVLNENVERLADVARYFAQAPRLQTIQFCGPLSVVAHLPLEQLRCCTFSGLGPDDLVALASFMDRFQRRTQLHLQLNFETILPALPLALTPVVSPIEELDICVMEPTGDPTSLVLAELFGALTLPNMQRLHLYGSPISGRPVYWPHVEGLSLLQRSASGDTLHSLTVHDVVITERELLECLGELPALQYLFISDYPELEGVHPAYNLITDSLLKNLTPNPGHPGPCLVPKLMIVDLKTLGQFDDAAFVEFAVQRSLVAVPADPFECAILWVPGHARQLGEATIQTLNSWMRKGRMIATCREYNPEEDDCRTDWVASHYH